MALALPCRQAGQFLKDKDGHVALLLIHRDERHDNEAIKAISGAKPSICSAEEIQAEIGCLPQMPAQRPCEVRSLPVTAA